MKAVALADLVLWLGGEGEGPGTDAPLWEIAAQADRAEHEDKVQPRHRVSAVTGEGVDALRRDLVETARGALGGSGLVSLNDRQGRLIAEAVAALDGAGEERDPLLLAEHLRLVRLAFDGLLGRTTTEDMLDALFGRFCIGK